MSTSNSIDAEEKKPKTCKHACLKLKKKKLKKKLH